MAEIQKGFLKGWDWNSNEKNPSSIATGLLTTVFLMGIMTQFLETILLQLIKLTLRGLFQPSNDYYFFHGKVGKVIWKEFGDPFFFSFSDVDGFEWKLELEAQTWVWEQSLRGEVTSIEGHHCKKTWTKISLITSPLISICSPFIFLFCIPTLNFFLFLISKFLFPKNRKLFWFNYLF